MLLFTDIVKLFPFCFHESYSSLLIRPRITVAFGLKEFEYLWSLWQLQNSQKKFIRVFPSFALSYTSSSRNSSNCLAEHQESVPSARYPVPQSSKAKDPPTAANGRYTHLNVAFNLPHALFSLGGRRIRFVERFALSYRIDAGTTYRTPFGNKRTYIYRSIHESIRMPTGVTTRECTIDYGFSVDQLEFALLWQLSEYGYSSIPEIRYICYWDRARCAFNRT